MKRLKPAKDGEWIKPQMKNYYLGCCDCGLVHRMDFRIVDNELYFRAFRADRYTAKRRKQKHLCATR